MLWTLLTGGDSNAPRDTLGRRFYYWCGAKMATCGKRVAVGPGCTLSPEAKISPRQGAITIGRRCHIGPGVLLQGNVHLGDHCSVQPYSILVGYGSPTQQAGCIRIGNHVRIASHTRIIAANHVFTAVDQPIDSQGLQYAPITIEDDVWIGGGVSILAGVHIGTGCVIGAGAVVTKDIPAYSVAVGAPARVIKSRR